MKRHYIPGIIAGLLILLFCYTAFSKLGNMEEFRRQLDSQILPHRAKPLLSWLIPCSELAASILLVFPRSRLAGLYGAAFLMLLFSGYTGLVLFNVFNRVPCSCGGVLRSMGFGTHFVFNCFFFALSVAGIVIVQFKKAHQP